MNAVDYVVDSGQRIDIFFGDGFQTSVIDTKHPGTVLLLHKYHWRGPRT